MLMAIFGSKETAVTTSTKPASPAGAPKGATGRQSAVGGGILIRGRIEGSESLRIDGRVEGEIELEADLVIGSGAEVRATVRAKSVTVEGRFAGDLSAESRIELVSTARVEGTISAPRIAVAEGAIFRGTVDMSSGRSSRRESREKD
jgi:cytoskeletal protein CcmA (bactofilin family)